MSLARDQADWIRRCEICRLSDTQRVLLETVLAACDPEVVLTRHVASAQTAVAAVAWARSALESRARPGRTGVLQPYPRVVLGLVSGALEACESTELVFGPGALAGVIGALRDIENGAEAGLKDTSDCGAAASRLAAGESEIRATVTELFTSVWQETTVEAATTERLAQEMAALSLIEGRWHPLLTGAVRTVLNGKPIDAGRLLEVLLPAKRDFRVAVVVEGASHLESLAELMDPAAAPMEIPRGGPVVGWGNNRADLEALADLAASATAARGRWLGDQIVGHVLLTLTVRANDLGDAVLRGRRLASESLDQYVAGQRVAELRLRPETLARDHNSGKVLSLAVPALGSSTARPLTTGWPSALRESVRTAHIARVTEAPMAAAGLFWAALEALEVKPGDTARLAAALSLQAVRQQTVDLHGRTRTAVAATVRAARASYRAALSSSASLEAAATAAVGNRKAALEKKAAAARTTVLDRHAALERALEAEACGAAVDAWVGGEDGKLRDPDRWLDVLAPPADAEPGLRAAAEALVVLTDYLGGETGVRLQIWRTMLTNPASLADWIKNTANRFTHSLDWLYGLRNTALHDGRFASTTDMLDAHAGRALVDLTLEALGNWYHQAAKTNSDRAGWTAINVVKHLACRQATIVAQLGHNTRTALNVTHLTSPTSTGWDRARPAPLAS